MLTRLVSFSLAQRLLVLLATLLLAGAGWWAFQGLPIDAFPDVSSTQVKIIMKAPGMTPEEVESRIVVPIEVEMLGIPRQRILRSVIKYGLADITLDFEDGTDVYWARAQVAERLNAIGDVLPRDISGGVAPLTTTLGEMFMFTIEGGGLSLMERRTLLDTVIRPALRTVRGVADVNALGGTVRSFEVVPDAVRMAAAGVSTADIETAIAANNRNDGAGRLVEGEEVLLVRSEAATKTLEELGAITLALRDGIPVRLADVAEVRIGALTRYGVVTKDGRSEAVQGLVLGLAKANAREVVEGVEAKLAEIAPTLPKDVRIDVFYNRAGLVDQAVGTVARALVEATVLVLILLVLFLGNLRAALTVALVLPLAALTTFILMRVFDMSANLMSLGGLAIAIGMLVDAAVVVVENIVEHNARGDNTQRREIIQTAVSEVAVPVTSGVLIIITVFLPLLTLQGLEGKLFIPVALTIIFALAGSLLLSLTVIPVLASLLIRHASHREPWLPRMLTRGYMPLLNWSLAHPRPIGIFAGVLFAFGVLAYVMTGKTFMPTMDEGDLIVGIEKLPTISLEQTAALDLKIQQAIMRQVPEVTGIVARAGSDEIGLDPMGLNQTDTYLLLKPREQWRMASKEALIDELRKVLNQLPGVNYSFTQPIDMRVSEMIIGVRGDLAVKVFGPDLAILNRIATQIETLLTQVQGSQDVYTVRNEGVQYLRVVVDPLAAGQFGLSAETIQNALRAQLEGRSVGVVIESGRRTPILIRGSEQLRSSPDAFNALQLVNAEGVSVPLSAVARIERADGPVKIEREMGSRFSVVIANVADRDLVGFVEEARSLVESKIELPNGYRLSWGGQFENQQRAAQRLAIVVPVALGLIFLMLFSTFGSIRQALLVLSNIPFALIGGIFALWVSGEYLSVPASVGFIALLGIAVLNGVVMVSHFNELYQKGMDLKTLVVAGAKRRLRPVMMTASITAFGLVPLLFASGPGSEVQRPLAIVVIGGLISATALTLIILPLLYSRFAFAKGASHAA